MFPDVCSPNDGAYTTIKFVNRLEDKVKIFWVNSVGEDVPRGTIQSGSSFIQSTYVGHVWKVVGEDPALPPAIFYAKPNGGVAQINSSLYRI